MQRSLSSTATRSKFQLNNSSTTIHGLACTGHCFSKMKKNGGGNMNIFFEGTSRVQPTARTEIAALLYKDDSRAPGTRHVYVFPRNGPVFECDKPRYVSIYSSTLEPLQYHLLYFHGEPGWSPRNYQLGRTNRSLSKTYYCGKKFSDYFWPLFL